MHRVIVIMAGGAGQRFWPLSRTAHPKQLLRLASPDRSLLEQAVKRAADLVPAGNVYIVTGRHLVEPIQDADTGIPAENVIGEPCKRNTAGCLVYAAAFILARLDMDAGHVVMGVLTADHRIFDEQAFASTVRAAFDAAEHHDALVTVGIQPTRPETGYGYIETGAKAEPVSGVAGKCPVYPVLCFHEKPDAQTAEKYMLADGYYWNSGMFFWRLDAFVREFDHVNPAFARTCRQLTEALQAGEDDEASALFAALPDKSIDYALMEDARHVLVARGRFRWDDLGAWDSLERSLPADAWENVVVGDPVVVDSQNCIVYNAPGAERMAVGVVGLRDMVVVVSEDAVLVVPKDQAQRVKAVVEALRQRGASQI